MSGLGSKDKQALHLALLSTGRSKGIILVVSKFQKALTIKAIFLRVQTEKEKKIGWGARYDEWIYLHSNGSSIRILWDKSLFPKGNLNLASLSISIFPICVGKCGNLQRSTRPIGGTLRENLWKELDDNNSSLW